MTTLTYKISTPNGIKTTLDYQEALKLSKENNTPYEKVFSRVIEEVHMSPMQKKIVSLFGVFNKESLAKYNDYIVAHTNEDGEIIE